MEKWQRLEGGGGKLGCLTLLYQQHLPFLSSLSFYFAYVYLKDCPSSGTSPGRVCEYRHKTSTDNLKKNTNNTLICDP